MKKANDVRRIKTLISIKDLNIKTMSWSIAVKIHLKLIEVYYVRNKIDSIKLAKVVVSQFRYLLGTQ